jgi:hypothetical protein
MLLEGKAIGAISVSRREPLPFSESQIALLQTFADQAVIAIENVRLFDEVQARTRELSEALEQQTATAEVLRIISSSPGELEPVFETMLANAVQICGAKFGVMSLREGMRFASSPLTAHRRLSWSSGGETRSYDRRRVTIWGVWCARKTSFTFQTYRPTQNRRPSLPSSAARKRS